MHFRNKMPPKKDRKGKGKKKEGKIPEKIKKYVKQQVEEPLEHKVFSNNVSEALIDFNGEIYPLTGVTQGDADKTRDGDQLRGVAIELNYELFYNTAFSADATQTARIMIFSYIPSVTIATPTSATFLEAAFIGTQQAPLSFHLWDARDNYKCHYDKVIKMNNDSPNEIYAAKLKIPYKKRIQFTNGATQGSNHVFLVAISDISVISGKGPELTFISRFIYTDA